MGPQRFANTQSLPQLVGQAPDTRKNGVPPTRSLPLLRQQEANTLRAEQKKSRTCVGFFVPLPHLQQKALRQNTITRAAKLQHSPVSEWRDIRPGIYSSKDVDLAKNLRGTTTHWKPHEDLAKLEAEEMRRLEKVNQRKAIQRPQHTLSMWDRKNFQNTALAGDKQFVAATLSQISEDPQARDARVQCLRDKWQMMVFLPMPGHVLSKQVLERMPPPPMQEEKDIISQRPIEGEEEEPDECEEFIFEPAELARIVHCCRKFYALGRETGPQVLTRAAFCRMACAFDGFRSQGRPWLSRSVAHFDRLATKVMVQSNGTSLTVLGVRMPDAKKQSDFNPEAPLAMLFRALVQDMLDDMGWVEARQTPTKRVSLKRNLRMWFFESLLPGAEEYALARQEVLEARIGEVKPEAGETGAEATKENENETSETNLPEVEPIEENFQVEELEESEEMDLDANEKTELYAHTFVGLKGENLLCQLLEPEVLCLWPQLSEIFGKLFEAYADLPMPDGSGSMSLKGLLRCCCDFDLFPDRVDYQTILWIYNSAEGCKEVEFQAEPQRQSNKPALSKSRSRVSGERSSKLGRGSGLRAKKSASKMGSRQMEKGDTSQCVLYHGKWIRQHLAWMTKSPQEMSTSELRAIGILTAAAKWMECQCLTAKELLAYFDDDGNAALSADELSTALQFMSFEDPPTKEDIEDVYNKLLTPKAVELDLEVIGMAMTAVSKREEYSSAAASVMVKDLAQMNKEQCNAAIFFREMLNYMRKTGTNSNDLFLKLDDENRGFLTGREITQQFRCLVTVMGCASPAFEIDNAFLWADPQGLQTFSKSDFCKLMAQVKRAERMRAQTKNPHPLFLTTSDNSDNGQNKSRKIFGPVAFMESMMKIGLEYLSYHGNPTQQALPSAQKLIWLFAFLTWSFDAAIQRQLARPGSESSRCGSRCGSSRSERLGSSQRRREELGSSQRRRDDRPYPRFLPPLQRLIARHPRLFTEALKEPCSQLDWPEWASSQDFADVLLQQCTDLVQKEREHKEGFVPFHRILLRLAAEGLVN
ncbi:Hypothetical protein SCF082_LOCUS22842 [Durusdinium trenchii]|uniref:Calmodulin n=1 Tax=Durusdinium trenchii TaxID=1381693 RepID=A0ABP0LID0_9DINO